MENEILASMRKKASEFMKDPKKKMGDYLGNMLDLWDTFESKHRWIACLLVYGILLFLVYFFGHVSFDSFHLFYPPDEAARSAFEDNSRSLLCTVIESEATIVAIIISLTVIAVQFTASAYSPRVTDIMLSPRKNPDMFFLLSLYGLAIFFGLILLKKPFESSVPSEDVSVVLWFGVFLYIALVPYILRVTKLMKPKNIIRVLSEDVTGNKISDYFKTVYFSWDNVPGDDDEKLKEFLENDFDIGWVKNAEIPESGDGKTISIIKDENSAEIIIDEKKEKATLKITDVQTHELKVKNEDGKLNIYKELEDAVKEVASSLSTVGEAAAVKERYFFSWNSVSGVDDEKLKEFLENDFDIGWVKNAEIPESDDGKTISIIKDENSAEIIIDEKKEKATLKITDVQTHELKVKNENGKLKIYKKTLKPAEDPVQPIVDIVYGSLRIYDLETIRYGLKKIVELIPGLINPKDREKLSSYFCDHLDRIGKLAASIADEDSTKEVIKSLEKIGKDTAKEGLVDATKKVVFALKDLGEAATEKGLKDAIEVSTKSLGVVGKAAAAAEKEGLEDTKKEDMIIASAKSLGVVGKAAAKKELEDATLQTALSLETVGEAAVDKKLEDSVKEVASSLGALGEAAADKGLEDVTLKTVEFLKTIGCSSAESRLGAATPKTALSLKSVGVAVAKKGKGFETATTEVAKALKAVGVVAAENVPETATTEVAKALKAVGVAAVEKKLEEATRAAVKSLRDVEKQAVKWKLKNATVDVVVSLETVGKAAAEGQLQEVTSIAIFGLEDAKEIVDKPDLESTVIRAADALKVVGKAAIESELDEATENAVLALIRIGETATEKSRDKVIMRVNKSLAGLKSNSNIVEPRISEYESSKQNDPHLQKFIRQFKAYSEKMKQKSSEKKD